MQLVLGKHIKVGAFTERVQLGADTPLQQLFREIAGNVIRPKTIEHDERGGNPAQQLLKHDAGADLGEQEQGE